MAPAAATAAAPVDPEKEKAEKAAAVKRTVEFQKKRAEAGSETAQYDLGMRYLNGDGVEQDLTLARKWLKASAEKGHKFAAKKLAELESAEPKAADATKELPAPKPAEAGADSKPGPKPAE
jgi:TPR repeat protein